MGQDFWIVLPWWGTLFLVGAVAWPLTKKLFAGWHDEGYLFSKAVGMALISWIVYALGTIRILPFVHATIFLSLFIVFLTGIAFSTKNHTFAPWRTFVIMAIEELFFLGALLFWSWIKGHEPSIRGLEKFMDYGFMQSVLNSTYFPPADMWYAGLPINYYYFGHLVTAVLTKLSGLDLSYTFTLMLATLFALTLTMSFSIGFYIGRVGSIGRIVSGTLTAFLVTLAGNMQTIYAFTRGYTGENVKPFWELLWPIGQMWQKLPEGMQTYWYANATRFIPLTIHEFPGYSFVVSDVHGHVLSIPFVLLAIAMLITFSRLTSHVSLLFYGFLVGVLLMTNPLDGPIYLGLFLIVVFSIPGRGSKILQLGVVVAAAIVTSLPFLSHFKSFVSGIAVNCPPAFLANTKIGPLMFEGVEKCQVSPLWMWWLLWGFFVYCGVWILRNRTQKMLIIFFLFALALVIFPELFYFKDIYPAHFRSNTMFKLGYQAFILLSIVAGYAIVTHIRKKLFLFLLLPQLFLVSTFPMFAIRSYFGGLKKYEGIEGLGWLRREYPADWAAIAWLKSREGGVIVEADGDSYTDYARFSAFTGMPTVIGWPVHEWLWRGSYDVVAPRREDVRLIYESPDPDLTREILARYSVRFIIVGKLEREKYKNLNEKKIGELGREVFRQAETVIYETY